MNERKARALIEKHFVEPLSPRKFSKLWEHVSSCEACRAHYDRLLAFEERFDGGRAEVERIGQSLFEELDGGERKGLFAGGFAFTWPFPTVIAGAAAALALMVLTRSPAQLAQPDEFSARGGPTTVLSQTPELLGACFREVGKGPEGPQNLTAGAPYPSCPRGGRLALAYRRARPGDQLVVFALAQGEPTVLIPAPGTPAPALAAGDDTKPLRGSFAIAPDAPEGEVALIAVFGPAPDVEKIKAALADGGAPEAAAGEGAVVQKLGYRLETP